MTTIEKLKDLHHQATTERSHNYTGAVILEAIRLIEMQEIIIRTSRFEIQSLRLQVDLLGEYKTLDVSYR